MNAFEVEAMEAMIEAHAESLRQGDAERAQGMAEHAVAGGYADAGALMAVAEGLQAALAPVTAGAAFRERLHAELVAAARRAQPSRAARLSAAVRRRQRMRILVRGGAAVAVIGIAAAMAWRGKTEQAPVGS